MAARSDEQRHCTRCMYSVVSKGGKGERTSREWRVRKERNGEEWERKEAKVVVKVVEKDEAVLLARLGTGIVSHYNHMTPNSICMQRKKKARKPETT